MSVERQIAGLPQPTQRRVVTASRALASDPRPAGARKLGGEIRSAWRVRVGDYRVLYDVEDGDKLVVVLAVLPRRSAYRSR